MTQTIDREILTWPLVKIYNLMRWITGIDVVIRKDIFDVNTFDYSVPDEACHCTVSHG